MAEWHDALPEDLRGNPTLTRYETPMDAYRGLVEANVKVGESASKLVNAIRVPGPDATSEDRSAFIKDIIAKAPELERRPELEDKEAMAEYHATRGVPRELSGYENPEGFKGLPDEVLAPMQKFALKASLSKQQYQSMVTDMADMHSAEVEASDGTLAQSEAALKAEWGLAFEERVAITDRTAQQFTPEGETLEMTPKMRKVLYSMAEAMAGRGPQSHFQPHAPTEQITPSEAQEQLRELRNKMTSLDPMDRAGHAADMKRMSKLTHIAYPRAPA